MSLIQGQGPHSTKAQLVAYIPKPEAAQQQTLQREIKLSFTHCLPSCDTLLVMQGQQIGARVFKETGVVSHRMVALVGVEWVLSLVRSSEKSQPESLREILQISKPSSPPVCSELGEGTGMEMHGCLKQHLLYRQKHVGHLLV